MYFESMDQCELTVRYHLTMVQKEAWRKVVDELDGLCAQARTYQAQREERQRLEDYLIEMMAEAVYDNGDEEPEPVEYRFGERDPDNWMHRWERDLEDELDGLVVR